MPIKVHSSETHEVATMADLQQWAQATQDVINALAAKVLDSESATDALRLRVDALSRMLDAHQDRINDLTVRIADLEPDPEIDPEPEPEPQPPPPPPPPPPTPNPSKRLTVADFKLVGSCYLPSTPTDHTNPLHRIGLSNMTACLEGDDLYIGGRATAIIKYKLPSLIQTKDAKQLPAATVAGPWVPQDPAVLATYYSPAFHGLDRYDDTHTVNVVKTYYMVDGTKGKPTIHLHSKDGSQPSYGPWHLEGWGENSVGGNVCEIPEALRETLGGFSHGAACAFTPGSQTNTWGPGFIAFTPDKSVPAGGALPATALVFYPSSYPMKVSGPSTGQVQSGGAQCGMGFIHHGDRVALVCGLTIGCGVEHYKGIHPQTGTEQAGYWSDWYEPRLFFYDVADLAKVLRGEINHWEIMPYEEWNVRDVFINPVPAWQRPYWKMCTQGNRLAIIERDVMSHLNKYEPNPAIHVFELSQ